MTAIKNDVKEYELDQASFPSRKPHSQTASIHNGALVDVTNWAQHDLAIEGTMFRLRVFVTAKLFRTLIRHGLLEADEGNEEIDVVRLASRALECARARGESAARFYGTFSRVGSQSKNQKTRLQVEQSVECHQHRIVIGFAIDFPLT